MHTKSGAMDAPVKTWWWRMGDQVVGLEFDGGTAVLSWYNDPGCHCGDTAWEQPAADFREYGAPAGFGDIPSDVRRELTAAIQHQQMKKRKGG